MVAKSVIRVFTRQMIRYMYGGDIKKSIDETDKRIIACLRNNARMTMKELGEQVFLTGQAVKNRVERLEDIGILKRYTVNIDCPVFGYKIHAVLRVQMKKEQKQAVKECIRGEGWHILHCYQTTGENDYYFDVVFRDMNELNTFLSRMELVCNCEAHIVIKEQHDFEI